MHGSNCQRAGSGPVVALVVFSEVQGENAAWARCQSSSIGDATPAQKARQARRSAAMLVRIPTGPVRNPADGQKSMRFGERAVRVPERWRSEPRGPWLESHCRNIGVICRVSHELGEASIRTRLSLPECDNHTVSLGSLGAERGR